MPDEASVGVQQMLAFFQSDQQLRSTHNFFSAKAKKIKMLLTNI